MPINLPRLRSSTCLQFILLLLISSLSISAPVVDPISNPHAAPPSHLTNSNNPHHTNNEMVETLNLLPAPIRDAIANDTGFISAFLTSFFLILACELGDRTFFVAAILAMKSSRIVVWAAALAALAAMTVLSAAIGKAFPLLLDRKWTSIAAAVLFAYFGLQLLREWWKMRGQQPSENEELAEVEEELNEETRKKGNATKANKLLIFSPIFVKAFTMTALAEWGDRSQIATIALAASRDMYGVILGGVLGHALCTGLAVVGGRLLATKISERAVALMGGIMFILFAILTFAAPDVLS